MPWSDLAELFGASATVMAVLVVFWKGDDCLSKASRSDLAAWLVQLRPPTQTNPMAQSMLALFESVFEKSHFTWFCFVISFVFSIVFAILFYVLQFGIFPEVRQSHFADQDATGYSALTTVLFLGIILNGLGDFPSLYVTRKVLEWTAGAKIQFWFAIFVDLVLTTLVFFGVLFVADWLFSGLEARAINDYPHFMRRVLLVVLGLEEPSDEDESASGVAVMRSFAFTAYITSIWLWAAALGSLALRLAARSGPALRAFQYVLPIDEKPVRSLGILGFLLFFAYSVIILALKSIGLL